MTPTLAQQQLAGGGSLQDSNLQPTDYSTLSSSIKRQLNLSGYVQVTVYLCKELEKETVRLKRRVAELSLEKQLLPDVARGNFRALSGVVVRWIMRGSNTGCRNGMAAGCWGNGEGHNATS